LGPWLLSVEPQLRGSPFGPGGSFWALKAHLGAVEAVDITPSMGPWSLTLESWRLTLEPWRLTLEVWILTLEPLRLILEVWMLTVELLRLTLEM
jgi:hypothetical protein